MSANQGSAASAQNESVDKGKGKSVETIDPQTVEEESSEDESSNENDMNVETVEDPLEEVESKNILGSRTRGKQIDFAKAAQELPDEGDDDDEEGDEDFAESSDDEDRMEE